jgi:hypothetical protein
MMLFGLVMISLVSGQGPPPAGPPKAWQIVFRQTLPYVWKPKAGVLSLNPDDPSNDNFAILDKLDQFNPDNKTGYNFKLRWADPLLTETMHWKQTSNPFLNRTAGVVGYEAVKVPSAANAWGGLEYETGKRCLMDGSIGEDLWYYCIGYNGEDWGQPKVAMPAGNRPAYASELFAMDPKTNKWVLVFRQTLPHLINEWSVNEKNPNNESYAILDNLENFRGKDGKLELKLNWPDKYNSWHQSSNPVTAPQATTPQVPGYKPINVQFTGAQWGGLEPNILATKPSILQGSVGNPGTWFYAIGYDGTDWGEGIVMPSWSVGTAYFGAKQCELYVEVQA